MALDLITIGVVCADVMVKPVDTFPERGTLAVVPSLEIHLGGLAGVTASIFSRLGGSAGFVGKVGTDGFGDYIKGALAGNGVNIDALQVDSNENTSATVVLVNSEGERTFLHQVGANASVSEADIDMDYVKQAKVFHWGGPAITPGLEGAPMGRIMERVRAAGVKTSMDTCFDSKGVWRAHIEPALPHLDIIMSSYEEARHYTSKETDADIADFYLSFGAEVAMIKRGHEGMYVKTSGGDVFDLPAHNVDVVDTTGAGDAACGGFLYGYVNGWDHEKSARLANAVGGMTVQRMGGAEAVNTLDEVVELMQGR